MYRLIICLMAALVMSGCASEPTSTERLDHARNDIMASIMCGKEHARDVDDGISDAQTIALALSYRCDSFYKKQIDSYFLYRIEDAEYPSSLINTANNAYLSKQVRIETFLPQVMESRTKRKK